MFVPVRKDRGWMFFCILYMYSVLFIIVHVAIVVNCLRWVLNPSSHVSSCPVTIERTFRLLHSKIQLTTSEINIKLIKPSNKEMHA